MAEGLVKLRDLRREMYVVKPIHPRLHVLLRAAKRLGVARQDKDGEWGVPPDVAARLEANYQSTGFFGSARSLAGKLASELTSN
jgi:hypothetical protein